MTSDQLKSLSRSDLIALCKIPYGPAWNEFFRRFIPDIEKSIKRLFVERHRLDMADNGDVVNEVYSSVVDKLLSMNSLNTLREPEKVDAWLRTMAGNKARDWLRKSRQKNALPEKRVDKTMVYLDESIEPGSGTDRYNFITPEDNHDPEEKERIAATFKKYLDKLNEKERWVVMLRVLPHYYPERDDLEDLAKFTGKSVAEVSVQVEEMLDQLIERQKQKVKDHNQMAVYWAEILSLENALSDIRRNPGISSASEQAREIAEKITDVFRKLGNKRKSVRRPVVPKNQEIARLLGMNANAVRVNLHRAKKKLKPCDEGPRIIAVN